MKNNYFKLVLVTIVGLMLFSSCVIEDDIESASVTVNSTNIYTNTSYDIWGHEYNEHDVHFTISNNGDLPAYSVVLQFTFYTENGSVFHKSVTIGSLYEHQSYSSNLFIELENDYIEGYDVDVSWVD